jgi:hypothetical protein
MRDGLECMQAAPLQLRLRYMEPHGILLAAEVPAGCRVVGGSAEQFSARDDGIERGERLRVSIQQAEWPTCAYYAKSSGKSTPMPLPRSRSTATLNAHDLALATLKPPTPERLTLTAVLDARRWPSSYVPLS